MSCPNKIKTNYWEFRISNTKMAAYLGGVGAEGRRERLVCWSKEICFEMVSEGRDGWRMSDMKWDSIPNGWDTYVEERACHCHRLHSRQDKLDS